MEAVITPMEEKRYKLCVMTDSSVAKVETKIDTISSKVGVSESGSNWVKSALDPFPDQPRDCAGYPDQINGPSIVQKLKFQKTFSRPSSVAPGNWDCHMFFSPWDNDVNLVPYDMTLDGSSKNGNTAAIYFPSGIIGPNAPNWGAGGNIDFDTMNVGLQRPCGGLVVRATSSGSNMTTYHNSLSIPIPNSYYQNGRTRVIAKAFEVHNTTAELYRQGAVTTYRDPTVAVKPCNITYGAHFKDMSTGSYQFYPMGCRTTASSDIPTNVDQVLNILDSREWKAEDGCYVVATLANSVIPPLSEQDAVFPLVFDYSATADIQLWYPQMSQVGTSPTFAMSEQNGQYPGYVGCFNTSGAWFTGLSDQTTLTIVVHYIIERFPNETNNDLVVLTTRSPAFDPAAMELYTRTASYLPTGVPVSMNPDGEWIKNVADMLGGLGVPGMPLVKGVVDLWNATPSMGPKKKNKPKKQAQKPKQVQVRRQLTQGEQAWNDFDQATGRKPAFVVAKQNPNGGYRKRGVVDTNTQRGKAKNRVNNRLKAKGQFNT